MFPLRKAVILAAGRGTRMGEITRELPKPMLPVQGRPLLEHICNRLAAAGVDRLLIVVGYRHDLIEKHFRNWQPALEFRLQQPVNGTGSAAQLAREFAAEDPFLLTYGDILCEPAEYARCGSILLQHHAAAAVAVKAVDDPWQGAAVYEDQGRILEIIEKPPKGTSSTHWNSAGFYAFQPVLFDYLDRLQPSARNEYELTSALHDMLTTGLDLRISPIEGAWRDVGRPEDLEAVNNPH